MSALQMGTIAKVENLSKIFGNLKAFDKVSFEVKEGEIFGFVGPNGAGKTTTINMLTTLLKPTSGCAIICGFDIFKDANEVRRNVGVVPQEYTADEDMTGLRNRHEQSSSGLCSLDRLCNRTLNNWNCPILEVPFQIMVKIIDNN